MRDLAQRTHIVPITAPVQKTATFVTPNVQLKTFEKVQFLVLLGAAATDSFTMTVTCSAVTAGSTATAIAFKYRLSAAAGTDTLGDVTDCVSTGLVLTHSTYDNKVVLVEVEGIELTADKPYVGLTFTDPGNADLYVGVVAILSPKYPVATSDGALT